MPLIPCGQCGHQVSDQAASCPGCGAPVAPPPAAKEFAFYQPYAEFAKTLRTWFVAYGIGAPVLMLTNKDLWAALQRSGSARSIAEFFLAGAFLQIFQALLYKHAMWTLYSAEITPTEKNDRTYKMADWLSSATWIEVVFDSASLVLFGVGTYLMAAAFS
jgi:hypothetical protein